MIVATWRVPTHSSSEGADSHGTKGTWHADSAHPDAEPARGLRPAPAVDRGPDPQRTLSVDRGQRRPGTLFLSNEPGGADPDSRRKRRSEPAPEPASCRPLHPWGQDPYRRGRRLLPPGLPESHGRVLDIMRSWAKGVRSTTTSGPGVTSSGRTSRTRASRKRASARGPSRPHRGLPSGERVC